MLQWYAGIAVKYLVMSTASLVVTILLHIQHEG
jgi:hypothetical protein